MGRIISVTGYLILITVGIFMIFTDCVYAQNEFWSYETVIEGKVPAGALSNDRVPMICYSGDSTLRFCYKDVTGWHDELAVSTTMGAVSTTSVRVDSLDRFHLTCFGYDIALLITWIRYWYRDDQGWHGSTLVFYPDISGSPTLVLDDALVPHVLYAGQGMHHWQLGASGGETEVVDPDSCYGGCIDLNGENQLSICYVNEEAGEFRYSVKDATGWDYEVIATEDISISRSKLLHDDAGNPHIVYYNTKSESIRYANKASGNWSIDTIADSANYPSLALDVGGHPHISFYDKTNGDLKYAFNDGRGWEICTIDTTDDVGKVTSIQLDEFENVFIFYFDETNDMVKYAFPALRMTALREPRTLTLQWSTIPGVQEFWLYGAANNIWFPAEVISPYTNRIEIIDPAEIEYSISSGIGDTESNWTYQILAMDDQDKELARSNRAGELDFEMDIP